MSIKLMHFFQLNHNLKNVQFMKSLLLLFFTPDKKKLVGLCWSMLLVLEPNLSFQAIATPTGSLAQTSTNPQTSSSDTNKKPDANNSSDTNKKPDANNSSDTNEKPDATNSSDANKKPDATNSSDTNKKPDATNSSDTNKKPDINQNPDGTNSSDTNKKPETNEQSTVEEDVKKVIKELKGKWQGKDPSSNETMFYIFTEDNKLFIINKSQFGLFGVEAKYQVINVKNKPMQIDVDFGKNKTVQTIFEFANKLPLPNQKLGIKQLRIELANLNSGNRPTAFSEAKTIILTNVSEQTKLENTPIVEYRK